MDSILRIACYELCKFYTVSLKQYLPTLCVYDFNKLAICVLRNVLQFILYCDYLTIIEQAKRPRRTT